MSRRHNKSEYKLLSEHKLEEVKTQLFDEYTRREKALYTWLQDELERAESDYKNMHAVGLDEVLAKL